MAFKTDRGSWLRFFRREKPPEPARKPKRAVRQSRRTTASSEPRSNHPHTHALHEIRRDLRSLDEWRRLCVEYPMISSGGEAIVQHALKNGVNSSFFGSIGPQKIAVSGNNYREAFNANGFNSRQRALLELLLDSTADKDIRGLRIFAHEGITPLALLLRGRYPRFLGSEYAKDEDDRRWLFPIPAIDVTKSGLPDASFDIVLSAEVLEHVPDLQAALSDTARILVSGGQFIATVPFHYNQNETELKARIEDGRIAHLTEPEYHGNPVDPVGGSLVFQIPGWDLLLQARVAGFSDAKFVFWSSQERGFVTSPDLAGVHIFVATR